MQHGERCTDCCPRIIDTSFSASLPQDTSDDTSSSPATTRSDSTSTPAPGNPSREPARTKNTNKNRDIVLAWGHWLRDLPEWSEEFTENLEDEGVLASRNTPAHTSHDSDSERLTKVVSGKHIIFTHIPKDRIFRNTQENQDYKGSLQEAYWWCSTSCRKIWWLDNSRSQSLQRRRWISKQSPIRSHSTRLGCLMSTILLMWNKNFSGTTRNLLENCLKFAHLARIGRPDILWSVHKLARTVTKWTKSCDKRLARLHSSYKWLLAILLCGKHSTTMQTEIVSRLWFCRTPWRLKINLGWSLMYLRKSNICSSQLDVQEANISPTVLQNRKLSLWMLVFAWTEYPRMIFGTFVEVLNSSKNVPAHSHQHQNEETR